MLPAPNNFLTSESGAVTVEFVPLLSAIIALTLTITGVVYSSLDTPVLEISGQLNNLSAVHSEMRTDNPTTEVTEEISEHTDNGGLLTNNGWGNGDQHAAGNSGPNNNSDDGQGQPGNGGSHGNNGRGNGEQPAPGKSGLNNNIYNDQGQRGNGGPQGNNGWGNGVQDAPGNSPLRRSNS